MMTPSLQDLTPRVEAGIRAPLRRLRRRALSYVAIDGAVRVLAAFIVAGVLQLVLDWWLRLTVDQRAGLNLAITSVWLYVVYRHLVAPLLAPLSDRALAAAVDRAHPELHEGLSTAVQFADGEIGPAERNSPVLARSVIADACAAAADVRFFDVLNHRRAKKAAMRLGGLAALIGSAWLIFPDMMGLWFRRNWLVHDVPWPQRTTIIPEGFDTTDRRRIPRGDELDIGAEIQGRTPPTVTLEWWTAEGRTGSEVMDIIGQADLNLPEAERRARARVSLGPLTEPIDFRITGGDEYTRTFRVEPIERPAIVRAEIRVTPPTYTRLVPIVYQNETTIEILAGSSVVIDAHASKPIDSARFVGPAGAAIATELVESDRIRLDWATPLAGTWTFELRDRDGWQNLRGVRYNFKVVTDQPPTAKLALADISDVITPAAELSMDVTISDVYGISAVGVFVQRNDDPPTALTLGGFEAASREYRTSLRYDVDQLSVAPGDRLLVWSQGSDVDPVGPNVGRSEPLLLRVLTPADFLSEMAKREMELRQEFERLISEQSGVKDAIDRLLPSLPESGAPPATTAQRLGGLVRRQDSHAARTLAVRRSFERILAEMRRSRVAKSADEQRLSGRIGKPLEEIGTALMPRASGVLGELRRQVERTARQASSTTQTEILRKMRQVLASMLELEGYREAVALLQEIIADQKDVKSQTGHSLSTELDALLNLDGLDHPANPPKGPASQASEP
ncbi:MAG: hypothetical protein ACKVS9_01655 [Phycisphaerae bacterium]